ncbi:MAG: hypothetical protein V4714_00355 [Bacteroidota bacterium]
MEILVLKTNIKSKRDLKAVEPLLNAYAPIMHWNVDRSDIDRVLRVVTASDISEGLIRQIQQAGYVCEALPD